MKTVISFVGRGRMKLPNCGWTQVVTTSVLLAVAVLFEFAGPAAAATPPYLQCPAVGAASSCNVLVTVNGNGTATTQIDSSLGPYDGSDDMLVGIQNNSGRAVSDVTVVGASGSYLFSFDSDGLCSYVACAWSHSTGYEGPITQFVPDITSPDQGTVHFTSLIATGGSTYFSLEGAPNASTAATVTPTSTVKPAPSIDPGYWMIGHGHNGAGGVVTPSPSISGPGQSNSSAAGGGGRHVDPCFAQYGSGKSRTYTTKGLFGHKDKHTVYDRDDSLGMVCGGFGASADFHVTPAMECGFIAAVAGAKNPAYGAGATAGCEALDPDRSAASMACDWLSTGLGFVPNTLVKVIGTAGGLACASAAPAGDWFESLHEKNVARAVSIHHKCIVFSDRSFGPEWHAESCKWKP